MLKLKLCKDVCEMVSWIDKASASPLDEKIFAALSKAVSAAGKWNFSSINEWFQHSQCRQVRQAADKKVSEMDTAMKAKAVETVNAAAAKVKTATLKGWKAELGEEATWERIKVPVQPIVTVQAAKTLQSTLDVLCEDRCCLAFMCWSLAPTELLLRDSLSPLTVLNCRLESRQARKQRQNQSRIARFWPRRHNANLWCGLCHKVTPGQHRTRTRHCPTSHAHVCVSVCVCVSSCFQREHSQYRRCSWFLSKTPPVKNGFASKKSIESLHAQAKLHVSPKSMYTIMTQGVRTSTCKSGGGRLMSLAVM